MFALTHLAIGLIIGKISGNYIAALIGALFLDLDHVISYVKHKIIFKSEKLLKTIKKSKDCFRDQRNFLHTFLAWIIISLIIIIINFNIGIIFSLGYLSHLLLDLLDNSEFRPFYPSKKNIKGPIKYFSKSEIIITIILFLIFFFS